MRIVKSIPYSLTTERLFLRCWEEQDAAELKATIDANLEHLRRWMVWARNEPEPIEKKHERIVRWRDDFLSEHREFAFGVFEGAAQRLAGACSIKLGDDRTIACLGYWLRTDAVGNGYASEAVGGLVLASFHVLGIPTVEVFCHPQNARSAAIPRRLGFTKLDGEEIRRLRTGEERLSQIWRLNQHDVKRTPIAQLQVSIREPGGEIVWKQCPCV